MGQVDTAEKPDSRFKRKARREQVQQLTDAQLPQADKGEVEQSLNQPIDDKAK